MIVIEENVYPPIITMSNLVHCHVCILAATSPTKILDTGHATRMGYWTTKYQDGT